MSSYVGIPSWLLKLRGKVRADAKSKSTRIEDLRPTNRPPRYDYGTYKPGKASKPEVRDKLVQALQKAFDKFHAALDKRQEQEMDERKGAFGGMHMRLFAEFVVKHAVFHLSVVRTRLVAAGEAAEHPGH